MRAVNFAQCADTHSPVRVYPQAVATNGLHVHASNHTLFPLHVQLTTCHRPCPACTAGSKYVTDITAHLCCNLTSKLVLAIPALQLGGAPGHSQPPASSLAVPAATHALNQRVCTRSKFMVPVTAVVDRKPDAQNADGIAAMSVHVHIYSRKWRYAD